MRDWGWRARVGSAGGVGSGFLVAPTRVLTAAHVVRDAAEATVSFPGGPEKAPARVVRPTAWARAGDPGDVAVLELAEPVPIDPAPFADPGVLAGLDERLELHTYGFPKTRDGEIRFASVTTAPDWTMRGGEWWTVKTGDSIERGYSGAAVYEAATGAVHGMVTDADGGTLAKMLPVSALREYVEDLDDLLPLRWLDAPARRELRGLLGGRPLPDAARAEFAAIVGRPLPARPRTVWAALRDVAEGWPGEDRFARAVAAASRHLDHAAQWRLAAWRRAHLAEPAPPAAGDAAMASLIVRLEPMTHGDYELTVHTWADGREQGPAETVRVTKEQVRPAVEERVRRAAGALYGRTWMIEFAVPQEWLHKPFEEWHIDRADNRRMRLYPVAVRDVERLRPGSIRRDLAFRRWQRLTERGSSEPREVPCRARSDEFESELEADDDYGVLVYASRPAKPTLRAALRNGVPVMLWPRATCGEPSHDACAGRSRLDDLVPRVAAEHPHRLPALAKSLRQEALTASGPHCGHALTLLWDDPSRLPDPPLSMEA
ncbi:trypsin-like peptidase domain-containing protein [Actinomadura atramentaria]|uniref:VMAP-C domain-containing protein n=1 Tax=Actinomadura atramentaria TaxID=1990 RepID=UPI00036E1F52|nr:trypsin-like peptidase domain-containing protein [Actinomadura atramentaria]